MKTLFLRLPVTVAFLVPISIFLDVRIYGSRTILVGDSLYYEDLTFGAYAGTFFNMEKPS